MDDLFFEEIKNINWFSNCGNEVKIDNFPMKTNHVHKIEDMFKSISSIKWKNMTLDAKNILTLYLHNHYRDEYQLWNTLVNKSNEKLSFIDDISTKFSDDNNLGKKFISDIRWNIGVYAMEEYYRQIIPDIPIFFRYLFEVYKNGNVPCGYLGRDITRYDNILKNGINFSKFNLSVY